MADIIQIRRDTAANWTSTNPVLADGEFGIEKGSPNKLKIGDGITAWSTLPYFGSAASLTKVTATNANITAAPNTIIVVPHGVFTANRTIDISALATELDEVHIYNLERTYTLKFAGGTPTIYTYGNETLDLTEPIPVTLMKIKLIDGQFRITT